MRTLLLLRHAKSSWDDPHLDDFERPLARRGRRAAPAIAEYMREAGLIPDRVLCSPARRTAETWELVSEHLGDAAPVDFDRSIYMGAPSGLLALLRSQSDRARTILIVGHNPGIGELAVRMSGHGDAQARALMRAKYPTAALAEIAFLEETWHDLDWGTGALRRFVRPRDLT
jgi:phosphohistidine phosphatase